MKIFAKLSGKTNLKGCKSEYSPENDWMIVRKLFNPVCGDHFLIQNSLSGKILMKKMIGTDNEESATLLKESLNKRLSLKMTNVLEMRDYDLDIKSELCSKFFYFSIYYDYPEKDLTDLLSENINSEEDFPHETLMDIFYDALEGLISLTNQKNAKESGYLQMNKIFWDEETQKYKVIENILSKKVKEVYMELIISRNQYALLSPEIMGRKRTPFNLLDTSKLDTFNLGILLLSLGLNIKPNSFYDFKFTKLELEVFERSKNEFKKKYKENPLICRIIEDLLHLDPLHRKNLYSLKSTYPSHEQVSAILLKSNSHISTENERRTLMLNKSKEKKIKTKSNWIKRSSDLLENSKPQISLKKKKNPYPTQKGHSYKTRNKVNLNHNEFKNSQYRGETNFSNNHGRQKSPHRISGSLHIVNNTLPLKTKSDIPKRTIIKSNHVSGINNSGAFRTANYHNLSHSQERQQNKFNNQRKSPTKHDQVLKEDADFFNS